MKSNYNMEKWVYLFEIEEYQIIAKKSYDTEEELYQIELISLVNDIEVNVKFGGKNKQSRDELFKDEIKMKDFVESKFKPLIADL